ncbi:MAG: hypothetical protein K8L99_12975 [Anaerolineae bacterium]|nr:hypothetical protein [Anaerolineae bacterium]
MTTSPAIHKAATPIPATTLNTHASVVVVRDDVVAAVRAAPHPDSGRSGGMPNDILPTGSWHEPVGQFGKPFFELATCFRLVLVCYLPFVRHIAHNIHNTDHARQGRNFQSWEMN